MASFISYSLSHNRCEPCIYDKTRAERQQRRFPQDGLGWELNGPRWVEGEIRKEDLHKSPYTTAFRITIIITPVIMYEFLSAAIQIHFNASDKLPPRSPALLHQQDLKVLSLSTGEDAEGDVECSKWGSQLKPSHLENN